MPEWLDAFVSRFSANKKTVAEVNVKDLPKVNWKDETFYVNFTHDGAVLYNEYGNEVSLIDEAKSMEDVNNYLNKNSVVTGSTDAENVVTANEDVPESAEGTEGSSETTTDAEVTAEVDEDFNNELLKVTKDEVTDDSEIVAENETAKKEVVADEFDSPQPEIQTKQTPTAPADTQTTQNAQSQDVQNDNQESTTTAKIEYVSIDDYNKLLAKVKSLEKCVVAFSEAQHAYTEIPNDAYDLRSQDEEVKHFQESAEGSQAIIDKEHSLDLSKMSDRSKLNETFLNDIDDAEAVEVVTEVPEEVSTETVEPVEEVKIDNDGDSDSDDVVEVVEEPQEVMEDTEVVAPQDTDDEETVEVVDSDEVPEIVIEEDDSDDEEPKIVELTSDEDIDNFSNQVCPLCKTSSLQCEGKVGNYLGVTCSHCGGEFAVSDDMSQIYVKK